MMVNYTVDGPEDGPAVVLSGSLGSTHVMWDAQVPALVAAGFRVVRYDLRGHGDSPVPDGPYTLADLGGDVLALLDALGIQRAHQVGLSIGGMVCMWLGEYAADRVDRLVLCCTAAELGGAAAWGERERIVRTGGPAAIADMVVGRWFTAGYQAAHPAEFAAYREMIASTPTEGYAGCTAAIGGMTIAEGLGTISAPTLVIAAADDQSTTPEQGKRIADEVPSSRFEVISPGAHLINVEQPDRTTELIIGHLSGSAG
ncbi:3-oxoadipate enol-lactonase [Tamaricihabitans halophyticus]|uniref:3-oxoadipate enol-lactonase n=1 Tax=Tamaricihabitans halophyticus TaxID=1262583 RepID=A0A4R2PX65_9PSEU|nr:3-oxoadipate enol-lactonase [Tamaricihabitans halophyticus]TCP40680.1 3-oxoadipate enol-lactonase [Tamaricihabitans halophyticus]